MPTRHPRRSLINQSSSLLCALCVSAVSPSLAGPLAPPAGPIAPTPGPEPRIAINATNTPGDADSLFKITQPGSYYLTGNITGVLGKHGIEIAAGGVTLDLNGFDLSGVPAMGAFDGVSVTTLSVSNIAVVNGSVRGWGDEGVDLGTAGATNCRLDDLLADANAGVGILAHTANTISNCSARNNAGGGIRGFNNCTVSSCSAMSNTNSGIVVGIGSIVSNCSVSGNTVVGISANGTIVNCSAISNTGIGISGVGTILHCSAISNNGIGISADSGTTIASCLAASNTSSGISVGSACIVTDSTAYFNNADGIVCATACVIRGNSCASNGSGANDGAGIHVTGADNRIEGNNCTSADRGIDVDLGGNFISRNICSGNANNWEMSAGNIVFVVNGVPAGAFVGSAGGSAPGSADPNANFSY